VYKLALIEIVDKYTIASLKFDKGLDCKLELDFYREQLTDYDMELIADELAELKEIHSQIWDRENDFKKFTVEHKYPVEEVARRAIEIRNINALRYVVKNKIAEKLNDPIREVKQYG
jgi:hypothetical protein